MPIPRAMQEYEGKWRAEKGDADFSILAYCIQQVNEEGRDLSGVAQDLELNRERLERWLRECGYEYELQRTLKPIEPVAVEAQS